MNGKVLSFPPTSMLQRLREAEQYLTQLNDISRWSSLYIDYENPTVERLWIPWQDCRLYLHKIHACSEEKALYHPHPWASAMRIVRGSYKMILGYGNPNGEPPPIAARLVLPTGTVYEMTDPKGWHAVIPEETVYTIMVTAKPWDGYASPPIPPQRPLMDVEKTAVLKAFKIGEVK